MKNFGNLAKMSKKNFLLRQMTVVIVDGDPCSCEELRTHLTACGNIHVIGEAHTCIEALELMSRVRPDMVFLANELPDGSGFNLISKSAYLKTRESRIVVFTAHSDCVLMALRNRVDDVLLKPIDDVELGGVVDRMASFQERASYLSKTESAGGTKFLLFNNSVDFSIVDKADIGYFQYHSDMRCWEVVVVGKSKPLRLRHNIKRKEILQLSEFYIQVHQRFIINVDFLVGVTDRRCFFRAPFSETTHVVVGRVYREKLIDRFQRL